MIAEKVAQAMGYRLADKATVEAIFREYGMTRLQDEYDSIPRFWDRFDAHKVDRRKSVLAMLNHALCALARHGDIVILGRGGFVILQGYVDVLHVRIQAPLEVRVQRVREQPSSAGPGRAEEVVKAHDRLQADFIRSVYGADWQNAPAFDLVIDTGKIDPDRAAELIVAGARALPARGLAGPTSAELQVDKVLAEAVDEVLNAAVPQ
jgi:cytidylate kinase